ncbi:MAG: type IV toxin-antitoxin system AbiEi family antitoxin domain-containing protein [Tessaracoccus sp.]|uniref:type IV toxin-antitoxin system AbiEi family antitoxin domain-containing protein n=1 Tax=Tessaracoccus sp. TaxID=1971211 RepID=UPI001ED4449A|nr:type IV toxin-antitoxin system AbiEi family antitoxin domain-containing protein [Tessaracoccus sp.]MBK7819590.1 type IV toxin-antitoxin system AbiEi family antitoxin domain-containing protein [Tessaracoccus sp.]
MDRKTFATWSREHRGVVTRAELIDAGVSPGTIANRVGNGEWQRPFHGVLVLSSEPPSTEQRLLCVQKWTAGRAVFSHQTAAYLHGLRRDLPPVLEVSTPSSVGLRSTARCAVRRTRVALTRVGDPPRTCLEQTVVDLVDDAATASSVLDLLIKAIQRGMSVPRFLGYLARCRRVRHRDFVLRVTAETADGVESHLELEYLRRVERAHNLPRSVRQKRERIRGRWIRSDCWYPEFGVRAELDGELAHPGRATADDLIRDNDVRLALDEITLRYRWTHVWDAPCLVAGQVAAALYKRGWQEALRPCSPGCGAPAVFASLTVDAA